MSVPNQTPYNIYTANGLTTVFAYEFYLISASDIQVTINGNEVTSGYTVSGVGNTNGGEITFLTAPANGSTVIFERVTPTYRLTDYQDNGDLLADTVNKDFDRLWMAIQRAFIYLGVALRRPLFGGGPFNADGYRIANLGDPIDDNDATTKKYVDDKIDANTDAWKEADKKLDQKIDANFIRTLRVPESYIGSLPSVVMRRNKIVAMNNDGNPIMILPESGSASDVMIELAKPTGASNIGGLGFLTPEMFSENITLDDDFSLALHRTIEAAKKGPVKLIILGSLYKILSSFDIPDGVTIRGGGPETGVYLETAPAEPMHIIFNMACVGSRLENFGVYFNTGGQGSISAVQVYGVFLQANSKDCTINGLTINGKPGDTVMGFSNGIRCTGTGNKILFCDVQYCSMGITARGDKHQITRNYCNNHFVDENLSAWSSSSPYWDGITAEGLSNSLIADNICEYNGQSGIYIGGNNSLSYDNIISRNTIRYNFNRGIDNGVSGTVSTTNSVLRNIITSNVIYDNREPQLWLFNANDFVVDGNSVRITSNYASIFGSYVSSSTSGIATGGTSISGVIISNNRVIVDYASALYRVVLNGTNMKYVHNTVTGTPADYMWSIDANRLYNNTISRFQGTFKPTLLSGTGVTVTAATGYYSINDKVLRFSMQLTLSGSTPSGNLVFGYLPGMSSATIRISLVSANNATGWNTMTGSLKAYQDGTNKDQIIVYRDTGGVRNLDAAAYVGAASTILITGEIEVASTY
ncbi:TPA: right-handed parallel beta-helix repeat-containing protein [Klebsiella pneumoniae]|nr:right-handed parallel beta-helix repeat-containing protein [Klebsiella pneumoniae]